MTGTLPMDAVAERALLGWVILRPALVDERQVTDELFHDTAVRHAFRALLPLVTDGTPLDVVTAAEAIRVAGYAPAASLVAEAYEAAEDTAPAVVVPHLQAYARRRMLWRLGDVLQRVGTAPDAHDRETLETALDRLTEALLEQPVGGAVVRLQARVLERLQELEQYGTRRGLSTGFADVDRLLGGLPAGELVVVGGRPSVGKSALTHQIAAHIAAAGGHVLLITPEMSAGQVVDRMLCQRGPIDTDALLRARNLSDATWAQLHATAPHLPDMAVYDVPCGVAEIRAIARQVHARRAVDLLVVDHLGWVTERPRAGENYAAAVGRATKAIKAIGRRLSCAVLLVCQLNRQSEDGTEMRRPGLAQLRDSGEIEQDADTVLLVHRATREATEAEVIVAKQRNGPTGIVPLVWHPATTRFLAAASEAWEDARYA